MADMMQLLSSFLLVMAVWGGHHTNLASAKGAVVISNSATVVTEYWQTMVPNSPMPRAILDLLVTSAGYGDHMGKQDTSSIRTADKWTEEKYIGASLLKSRKIGLDSSNDAKARIENDRQKNKIWFYGWAPQKIRNEKTTKDLVRETVTKMYDKKKQIWFYGWRPLKNNEEKARKELVRKPVTKTHDHKNQMWFYGWGPLKIINEKTGKHFVMEPVRQVYDQKDRFRGPQANDDSARESVVQEDDGHQGESPIHGESSVSNIIFFEESLAPGSTITPYIQPSSTSGAPLLQRDIADTVPMSTGNFTDILAMFAPVSQEMASDVWMMLDLCERPSLVKGEKKTCATSVESMVEFAASVLTGGNTRGLRAFSSLDVPAQGVTSNKKYKVAVARRATESSETMTCHGMSFPFVVFMCHAVNPTRTYEVTLESEDLTLRMVLLAVCHLDTSEFDPKKMPGHAKPGDAPACHFIPGDSVLWAPVAAGAA